VSVRVLDLNGAIAEIVPGLSKRILRQHLHEIPHFKSPGGGKILLRSDELLQWIERYRVQPVALDEAYRIAEELTGRQRKRRAE
jgi:hypothetical protein